MIKKMISLAISASVICAAIPTVMAEEKDSVSVTQSHIIDKLVLGDSKSESEHNFSQTNTVSGVDSELSPQFTDENGVYCGGGIGDGLSYRQMLVPQNEKEDGMIQFTMKADPGKVTYVTVRVSGSQFGRGNLLMYGENGDKSVLDAYSGREYAELYNGQYTTGPLCYGRYYYTTYKLPEGMVGADGKVTLSIYHTGQMLQSCPQQ